MNQRAADTRTPRQRFPEALALANRTNDELIEGRGGLLRACFSHREDATLFGVSEGREMGWSQVGPRLEWVAPSFAGGRCAYEVLASDAGSELAFVVQFERGEARFIDGPPSLMTARRGRLPCQKSVATSYRRWRR